MKIEVKMFTEFTDFLPPDSVNGRTIVSLEEGSTVADLLRILGIPIEESMLILINGLSKGACANANAQSLRDGDVVAVCAPVGGG